MTAAGEPAHLLSVPRLGRRAGLLLVAFAFAVRIAAIAWVGFDEIRFGDAAAYIFAAKELVRTGHYPRTTETLYFRAPGYPYFLALATFGHPERVAWGKAANAALGALAALVMAMLSARIFRRRGVAIATGLAAAIHPAFVYMATDIQSEPLFLLLLLCSGYLLLTSTDRPSSGLALGAGSLLALAALTRPTALVFSPFLLSVLADRRYPMRARAHLAASAILGFLMVLAPWTIRNARVFGEFLPVNDAAGNAFYQGNSDWNVRFYRIRSREEYVRWLAELNRDMLAQSDALDRAGRASPGKRSAYFFRKALSERRGDPGAWIRLFAEKAWDWLRPYPRPWFWPRGVVFGLGAYYTLLTMFAIVGLLHAERRGVVVFALAVLVVSLGAHVLIAVVWRYRVPYWDPILLLYGVHGAADTLFRQWRRSS